MNAQSRTGMRNVYAVRENGYRFGFNGMEKDDEVKGVGNWYNYGLRSYDPRIGRPTSIDPLTKQFPELSPYQFYHNNPIRNVDLDGAEGLPNEIFNAAARAGKTVLQKATDYVIGKVVDITIDYAAEKTAEKIKEKTTPEQQQVIGLTGCFILGVGDEHKYYGPDDPITKSLRDAPKVNEARKMFLDKNAANINNGMRLEPLTEFGGSFGLIGLAKAGLDISEQFVGSMDINIYPSEDGKTATFVINNSTSYESATYRMGTSYERGERSNDAFSTTRQTYTFSEPISKAVENK
jgi:RHS repeat-associated protein